MYMQSEFNKLKQVIAKDLNNSIDKNLNVYLDKVTQNDNILEDLRKILFKLPEYQNLIKENVELTSQIIRLNKQLEESTTKNIKLNIKEIQPKDTNPEDLTILKLNESNYENKEVCEYKDVDLEEAKDEQSEDEQSDDEKAEEKAEEQAEEKAEEEA